jgi:hypothetical protein
MGIPPILIDNLDKLRRLQPQRFSQMAACVECTSTVALARLAKAAAQCRGLTREQGAF